MVFGTMGARKGVKSLQRRHRNPSATPQGIDPLTDAVNKDIDYDDIKTT